MGNNAQLAGFCLGIQLHTGQRQDMGLDLRAVWAQGINAARAVALGNGAWAMASSKPSTVTPNRALPAMGSALPLV